MKTKFDRYDGKAPTNKWHLVQSINGVLQENLYVRFVFVWDMNGVRLPNAPVNQELLIELEYKQY